MCEKERFINQIIKVGKKSTSNANEAFPLSYLNSQQPNSQADESNDTQKSVSKERDSSGQQLRQGKQLHSENSQQQQQVSPTDEEVDCLLQKTGFLDEKGWSKVLGGSFMRASVVSFTIMCCILAMINGALVAGYVSSVVTTIEKRFDIGSSYSGLVAASVEMGGASSVIFVSYFGSTRHIPGWIGLGAALTGVGSLLFTMPHVMAPAYTVTGGLNSTTAVENICRPKQPPPLPQYSSLVSNIHPVSSERLCDPKLSGPLYYVLIFVLAQLLIGVGGSPLYTLGTTYIDNHVSRMKAPSYIAFIYACSVFGPVLGFALGALMLQYYVDLLTFDTTALKLIPNHAKWVGAWWGGFVFIGALLLLASVPFYGFPKVLVKELRVLARQDRQKFFSLMDVFGSSRGRGDHDEETIGKNNNEPVVGNKSPYGKNLRDIPAAMFKILKNPIYVVTSLGICCEVSVVSGFVFFLPKYLEREFGATKSTANLLTGVIAIPGAVIGILMGGYCLRHCQLTSKGAIQLTLALNSIALAGFGLFFALGCDNVKIAGVTVPYDNHSHYNDLSNYILIDRFNLTSSCNKDCLCDDNNLDLVCGADEVLFFSPCHAGCWHRVSYNLFEQNYTNCSCTLDSIQQSTPEYEEDGSTSRTGRSWTRSASGGACRHICGTLIPFMVMLFIMTFVISGTQMPLLMVTIRSVGEQEKALALGLQFVMLRLFAYIPAPILYGWQIDQTCIFWTKMCGFLGNCLVYDLVQLRYKFVGISFAYKFFAAMFYLSIWILMWLRHDKTLKDGDPEAGKRISLMIVDEANVLQSTSDNSENTVNGDRDFPCNKSDDLMKMCDYINDAGGCTYGASGHTPAVAGDGVSCRKENEDSSDHDETVETSLDCTDILLDNNGGKKVFGYDDDSLDLLKHFSSFPLIDDDHDDVYGNKSDFPSDFHTNQPNDSNSPFSFLDLPKPDTPSHSSSTFISTSSLKMPSPDHHHQDPSGAVHQNVHGV